MNGAGGIIITSHLATFLSFLFCLPLLSYIIFFPCSDCSSTWKSIFFCPKHWKIQISTLHAKESFRCTMQKLSKHYSTYSMSNGYMKMRNNYDNHIRFLDIMFWTTQSRKLIQCLLEFVYYFITVQYCWVRI